MFNSTSSYPTAWLREHVEDDDDGFVDNRLLSRGDFCLLDDLRCSMAPRIPPRTPQTSRSYSLNAQSLPKNYCFSPVVDKSVSYFSPMPTPKYRSRSLEPDFRSARKTFDSSQLVGREEYFSDDSLSERSLASLQRHPISIEHRRQFAFRPNFETIPSIDGDHRGSFPITKPCDFSKSYFNASLSKEVLTRAHSLVADDRIIDVEYDSDTGWKTKSVRLNPFKKRTQSPVSRENLKLDLNELPENHIIEAKIKKKDKLKSSRTPKENILDKSSDKSSDVEKASKVRRNNFAKARSRSSATSNDSDIPQDLSEVVDEVFETFKDLLKDTAKEKSLSSSSETLLAKKRGTFVASKSRTSSVSIKEEPERIDHEHPNNSSHSPHAIANSPKKSSPSKKHASSDYDRDRGRSRHLEGGHRESFKKNERTNDRNSDQDRDASDRELKDGSLNRSLSNTDTNLEDRIGKDLVRKWMKEHL